MKAAAKGEKVSVVFMSQCVNDGFCQFRFGPSSMMSVLSENNVVRDSLSDPCMLYGSNCSFCLSHEYCGWCSTNVVYSDGSVGNQCAGFNPDPRKKNPFSCSGSYSTEMCLPGWICVPSNQTCVPTIPGSGSPQADCIASCQAKPGPPSQLLGTWRGLMIQNGYSYGTILINVTQSGITATFSGYHLFSGIMSYLGAEVFIKYTDGTSAGSTITGMYTNDENELVEYIEITFGGSNMAVPTSYKVGMRPPNIELVLAKCASPDCHF